MPETPKTDLQILTAILSCSRITPSQRSVFQGMFDRVQTGHTVRLSMKQKMWAESVYDDLDLDKERPPNKKIEVKDKSLISPFETMARPLKPPGRK